MAGTPLVKVLDKGKDLVADPNCQIISVDIMKEVNSIPRARLVLSDGDSAKQKFDLSNEASFEPGKEIEIQLGYMGEPDKAVTVFKGIVIKHGVKADKNTSSLIVDLRDKAIRLTTKRKNVVFRNKKDSDILKEILKKWNPEIENTLFKHREMVQYYCTDWDFVLSRADLNGHWVLADDGSMTIKRHLIKNLGKKKPDCRVEYGKSPIYDFEMEADIRGLYKSVQSKGWDIKEQKLSESPKKKSKTLVQGNLKPDQMAEVLGSGMYHLVDAIDLDKKELEVWADSKMRKSCLSMLKGRVRIPGDANIKPGGVIEVKGVGDRFNGKTYVTGVRHQVSIKGWQTDMQFGLSPDWFSQRHDDIVDTPAAGLVPAVHGLQVGVVEAFEKDPEKKFRVRVRVPVMDAGRENPDGIIWARLASLDAGDKRGIFFRPEKGDEVVLGFLNDDPRQPVILGSMHSDNNALPPGYEITKENNTKGILTRGSLKIMLNDEKDKECIEISTPKSNLIRLSDKDKGFYLEDENKNKVETNDKGMVVEDKHKNKVTLDGEGMKFEDKNKNEVTMNSSGIVLQDKSGNKIVAQAGGINIETGSNITIKGNMVTIEGAQVNVN